MEAGEEPQRRLLCGAEDVVAGGDVGQTLACREASLPQMRQMPAKIERLPDARLWGCRGVCVGVAFYIKCPKQNSSPVRIHHHHQNNNSSLIYSR